MDILNELRESRQSPATAHLLFLQNQKYGGLHAFMEGDADPSFYRAAILKYYADTSTIFIYKCGGKKDVYKTREKINSREDDNHSSNYELILIYFVDKDLSDILPETYPQAPDIYVTDFYSIENYLVSEFMVETIFTDCFNFTKGSLPDKAKLLQKFNKGLQDFYLHITPIMAWGVFLKRNGVEFEFSSVKLGRLFIFDENLHITFILNHKFKHYTEALDELCGVKTPAEFLEVEKAVIEELKRHEPKRCVRGKFELWFLLKFCESLKNILKQMPDLEFRYAEALLGERDLVKFLGPRIQHIPQSLERFLSANIKLDAEPRSL